MFDAERGRQLVVVDWETDFLPGFATGYSVLDDVEIPSAPVRGKGQRRELTWTLVQAVSLAVGERRMTWGKFSGSA
jgi:hypothetical protein